LTPPGVILYGPPPTGKSTITRELEKFGQFQLFRRLKAGAGRRDEYRMASSADLAECRERGDIIWENRRYGAVYVVDRPELMRMLRDGVVPVVHLGQPEAVDALVAEPLSWLVVALTCPEPVAAERIVARATGDAEDRLAAWRQTPALPTPDLALDTSTCSASAAAQVIISAVMPAFTNA